MDIWFSSDTHFSHKNIMDYSYRPFKTVDEMDETIIGNFNKVIKENDTLYLLGDFLFGPDKHINAVRLRNKIKCKTIIFIKGNHDHQIWKPELLPLLFTEWYQFLERKIKSKHVTFCHYALRVWDHMKHGSIHLFGHSHGNMQLHIGRSTDVGVDIEIPEIHHKKFTPFNYDEIVSYLDTKPIQILDHHHDENRK